MHLLTRQAIFAVNAAKLILHINEAGYTCTLGEAWRTPEMAAIYAKRGIGIKRSLHCDRLAIDLNLFKDGVYLTGGDAYKQFGEYWMTLNAMNRYGGDWDKDGVTEPGENDFNHFEMKETSVA